MRSRLLTALVLIAAPACSTPTMIAPRVSLAIEQVALSADGRHIGYQYTITNPSADTVWIPACGGVIRPDVSVVIGGQHTDTYSGSLCLANVDMGPAPVPPGGRYAGQSSVQVATGASFVPYIVVSLRRTPGGPARKVSGAAFNAP